jgi:hypothetical protein
MSVLFAPNSHVPHWSESVVLQTNPIPISYIRKSLGVLEPFLNEDIFWTRKYFRKSVQINRSFLKERSQNFGSRSFENRSEPIIGRHGRTERYTSGQIHIEINGTKLTPESHYRSLSDNVFQRTRDIPFQLGVGNNRDMLSPGNDGVAAF